MVHAGSAALNASAPSSSSSRLSPQPRLLRSHSLPCRSCHACRQPTAKMTPPPCQPPPPRRRCYPCTPQGDATAAAPVRPPPVMRSCRRASNLPARSLPYLDVGAVALSDATDKTPLPGHSRPRAEAATKTPSASPTYQLRRERHGLNDVVASAARCHARFVVDIAMRLQF